MARAVSKMKRESRVYAGKKVGIKKIIEMIRSAIPICVKAPKWESSITDLLLGVN